jgi:hypothetical protein
MAVDSSFPCPFRCCCLRSIFPHPESYLSPKRQTPPEEPASRYRPVLLERWESIERPEAWDWRMLQPLAEWLDLLERLEAWDWRSLQPVLEW